MDGRRRGWSDEVEEADMASRGYYGDGSGVRVGDEVRSPLGADGMAPSETLLVVGRDAHRGIALALDARGGAHRLPLSDLALVSRREDRR